MAVEFASLDDLWSQPLTSEIKPKKKKRKDVVCELKNKHNTENIVDDFLGEYQKNNNKNNDDSINTYEYMTEIPNKDKSFASQDNGIQGIQTDFAANSYSYEDLLKNDNMYLFPVNDSFADDTYQSPLNKGGKMIEYGKGQGLRRSQRPRPIQSQSQSQRPIQSQRLGGQEPVLGKIQEQEEQEEQQDDEFTEQEQDDNFIDYDNLNTNVYYDDDEEDALYNNNNNTTDEVTYETQNNVSKKESIFDFLLYVFSGIFLIFVLEQIFNLGIIYVTKR